MKPAGVSVDFGAVYRAEFGRLVAALTGKFGDISLAEEMAQDAFAEALVRWPSDGVPPNPGAWLMTTARNRAIDRLRRESTRDDKHRAAEVLHDPEPEPDEISVVPDDRLRLLFTCCHPAIAPEAQVALTLRLLGGLTVAEVGEAFLIPERTMAQRITRAKRKITAARIPYRVPQAEDLPGRLRGVLSTIYLIFNEGYLPTSGAHELRTDLCAEAIRLARVLRSLLPSEPEIVGLLALMLLIDARAGARFENGMLVPLADQDRSRWDRDMIREGHELVRWCLRVNRPGMYQVLAAINAVHADASSTGTTDWWQIVALYDQLNIVAPTPIVALNRAIAVAEIEGAEAGLALVDSLDLAELPRVLRHARRSVASARPNRRGPRSLRLRDRAGGEPGGAGVLGEAAGKRSRTRGNREHVLCVSKSMDVNAIFAEQDGIITRQQVFDAGMSRSALSRRVTSAEWSREAPCIYRLADRTMTPQAALRVAVYSAGDHAVAFGPSAAWWHGLAPQPPAHNWVNIPVHRALGFQPGRRVRRRDLRREDVMQINGLRVTGLPLTVLEAAVLLPDGQEFLDRALQMNRVTLASLIDCHRRNSRWTGAEIMAKMLAEVAENARSAAERRLIAILRQAAITGWTTHVQTLGQVLDVAFIAHRIAIVVDGWAWYQDSRRSNADRKRRNALVAGGWTVLRYTRQQLDATPERVIAEIRAVLEHREESLTGF